MHLCNASPSYNDLHDERRIHPNATREKEAVHQMTFPNHINEMHEEDYPNVISFPGTPSIHYGDYEDAPTPEIQYVGDFTTVLPRNELMAHIMNCTACESDHLVNYLISQLFKLTSDALSGNKMLTRTELGTRMAHTITAQILEIERLESAKYEELINHVNNLHRELEARESEARLAEWMRRVLD